jgi:hypothetical protein
MHPSQSLEDKFGPMPFDDHTPVLILPPAAVLDHQAPEPNLQSKDMAEVWAQGITVDDNNNEPNKVNAEIHVHNGLGYGTAAADTVKSYTPNHLKLGGRWAGMTWATIAVMYELQLFMLCFLMDYIKNTQSS